MKALTLYKKIYNKFRKSKLLSKPTEEELLRIEKLRTQVKSFYSNKHDATSAWSDNQKELIRNIQTDDPRNFTRWPVIKRTMFFEAHHSELFELRRSSLWTSLQYVLYEDEIGNPPPYFLLKKSSGNLIHHAYTMNRAITSLGLDLGQSRSIFEFGGGYGSYCRLIHKLGFSGQYIIYDLPIFSFLQEFYLNSIFPEIDILINTTKTDSICLIHEYENLGTVSCDTFIAMWSFSECPIELRKKIISKMELPNYFIIAYQEKFHEINNEVYFHDFMNTFNMYYWTKSELIFMKGNYLLLGKKK